jgi:hypothetical protein
MGHVYSTHAVLQGRTPAGWQGAASTTGGDIQVFYSEAFCMQVPEDRARWSHSTRAAPTWRMLPSRSATLGRVTRADCEQPHCQPPAVPVD